MTTLNLVLDEMLSPEPSEQSIYATELAKALIDYAPHGCFVEGLIAASPESDYAEIASALPGLNGLFKSALARRDLTTAWQHGFTPVPAGMIHAPSLFAPLRSHDRVNTRGSQIAVTITDTIAWTNPESLAAKQVSWIKAMAQRAYKYADAVVVPTHAVAHNLSEILPFDARVRVISGAVGSGLAVPDDADARVEQLKLPERYVVARGGGTQASGLAALRTAMRSVDVPLVIIGDSAGEGDIAGAAGNASAGGTVITLGPLRDADLSVVLDRATAFVQPSLLDGSGMSMLEAFRFATPVIHSDSAALVEVAGEAGLSVSSADADAYPEALAEAITRVLSDDHLRNTLGLMGADRAKLFSWRATAEGVWQLHADL